jgi:hypothetical protein
MSTVNPKQLRAIKPVSGTPVSGFHISLKQYVSGLGVVLVQRTARSFPHQTMTPFGFCDIRVASFDQKVWQSPDAMMLNESTITVKAIQILLSSLKQKNRDSRRTLSLSQVFL